MMQRGIETPDMDVRWVSSLSWYFLNFFGLNGLYQLVLGSDNGMSTLFYITPSVDASLAANSAQDMMATPFAGMGTNAAPGQPQDFVKLFKAEKDNLEFAEGQHAWVGQDVEDRVLRRYGRL
jgi:hypothetical protein